MKFSRATVVVLCLTIGVACVWAAQNASAPATPTPASAPAVTAISVPAPAPAAAPAPAKVEFKNEQEKLGYAVGCNIGTKLKTRPTAPNVSALSLGINQAFNGQTDEEKLSYALGCEIGASLKSQNIPLDLPMLTQAIAAILNKQTPAMTSEESSQVIMAWQKDVQAKAAVQAAKNLADGKAFLEANKKKEGVKELENGLQYKVIKEGTGVIPILGDQVKVNYKGTLINGTEFDSSYKTNEPAVLSLSRVIPGWRQALQLMKEGAKWELYIPAGLAYGENSPTPAIPANSTLIFEVELVQVIKVAPATVPGATTITPTVAAPPTKPQQ